MSQSKTGVAYWKKRVYLPKGTLVYSVKIQHAGVRRTIPLKTDQLPEAAKRARDKYMEVVAHGWEAAPKKTTITLEEYVEQVKRIGHLRPTSLHLYHQTLRRVMREIAGLPETTPVEEINRLPMSILTREAIVQWREAYVAQAKDKVKGRRRANSVCDQIKASFSVRVVEETGIPNPIAKLSRLSTPRTFYESRLDGQHLLNTAAKELSGTEDYKIILLGLFLGLRRNEIDKLPWSQMNLETGEVRIAAAEFFDPKTTGSTGVLFLPTELLDVFREYRARAKSTYVIEGAQPKASPTGQVRYRCSRLFERVCRWLRDYTGPDGTQPLKHVPKPLHTLRKELGAIVTTRYGIYAAQKALRHSILATTASFYADYKEKVDTGLTLKSQEAPDDPPS